MRRKLVVVPLEVFMSSVIVWFRRDLRLADNPALIAALESGRAIVPVYVHAPHEERPWQPGAASSAWLHRSLLSLDADLRSRGVRLVLRVGDSLDELEKLVEQTQAEAVYWNRLYEICKKYNMLLMVDDDRFPLQPGEVPVERSIRFRTLGCYPLTGAVESTASTLPEVIQETLLTTTSERQGRAIDKDAGGAGMEVKKQQGYF